MDKDAKRLLGILIGMVFLAAASLAILTVLIAYRGA